MIDYIPTITAIAGSKFCFHVSFVELTSDYRDTMCHLFYYDTYGAGYGVSAKKSVGEASVIIRYDSIADDIEVLFFEACRYDGEPFTFSDRHKVVEKCEKAGKVIWG